MNVPRTYMSFALLSFKHSPFDLFAGKSEMRGGLVATGVGTWGYRPCPLGGAPRHKAALYMLTKARQYA